MKNKKTILNLLFLLLVFALTLYYVFHEIGRASCRERV